MSTCAFHQKQHMYSAQSTRVVFLSIGHLNTNYRNKKTIHDKASLQTTFVFFTRFLLVTLPLQIEKTSVQMKYIKEICRVQTTNVHAVHIFQYPSFINTSEIETEDVFKLFTNHNCILIRFLFPPCSFFSNSAIRQQNICVHFLLPPSPTPNKHPFSPRLNAETLFFLKICRGGTHGVGQIQFVGPLWDLHNELQWHEWLCPWCDSRKPLSGM